MKRSEGKKREGVARLFTSGLFGHDSCQNAARTRSRWRLLDSSKGLGVRTSSLWPRTF